MLDSVDALPAGATLLTVDDGEDRSYLIAVDAPVLAEDMGFLTSITQLLKIAIQRRESDDHHRYQAFHDPLTGLANRALLIDRLAQALARQPRDDRPFALMMVDLDGFKTVNDTYGHPVGDKLLCHVANRLFSTVRAADTVARIGGDEFAIVSVELADAEAGFELARRIAAAACEPAVIDGQPIAVTATIGLVMATEHASPEDLLKAADADMYRRKNATED